MRDCQSEREGMLMHNKVLFVRPHKPVTGPAGEGKPIHCPWPVGPAAWAYIGSANLSESAWGRLVKDKVTKQPKLNCRNWECGVVVSVPMPKASSMHGANGKQKQGPFGMEVFKGFVPVPMKVPGEEYGDRKPWFYSEL